MRQSSKVEGTKIAQAAKDLNVTSVTIRRYIQEFEIETTSDENGIKVLPQQAMEELQEIRRLKEEGLTNPKVMEFLEDFRKRKPADKAEPKAKAKKKVAEPTKAREREEEEEEEREEEPPAKQPPKRATARRISKPEQPEQEIQEEAEESPDQSAESEAAHGEEGEGVSGDGKSKHSLTCQTCGKVFEHMNPRLRDCLECYRAKRKERRRGGAERHKNVIQHPLAQQVANKAAQHQGTERVAPSVAAAALPTPAASFAPAATSAPIHVAPPPQRTVGVRNYRKAIEETRQITGSLKRRLERPDLPEGERRWLEQIYAYQLILHQGWRHLAEYRAASVPAGKGGSSGSHSHEE